MVDEEEEENEERVAVAKLQLQEPGRSFNNFRAKNSGDPPILIAQK